METDFFFLSLFFFKFPNKEFLLRVSYMEIYNETVTDLLVDRWKRKPLEVREGMNVSSPQNLIICCIMLACSAALKSKSLFISTEKRVCGGPD